MSDGDATARRTPEKRHARTNPAEIESQSCSNPLLYDDIFILNDASIRNINPDQAKPRIILSDKETKTGEDRPNTLPSKE